MPIKALHGVRVIEFATGIAGPFCGKLLADYGAEVIKIEPQSTGDPSRSQGSFPDGTPHLEKSALFLHLNTNKQSVTLDIENVGARELLKRLLAESDIVVESFKPGKLESLGLGFDTLKELRPNIVMTSITPFGQTGPHKDYEFTELTIFAMGGAMHREGVSDREPLRYGGEIAQYYTGSAAAMATVAASLRAVLSGQPEWIDISIQECMAGHPNQAGRRAPYAYAGEDDPRRSPHQPSSGGREPYMVGTFKCKDGYVSFLPLGPRMWPNFTQMIGRPELVNDLRFSTTEVRAEHYEELEAIFDEWLGARTRYEVFEAAQKARLPGGPVLMADEVMTNEHFKERGYFADIEHPDAGMLTYTGLPFDLSNATREPARPAPRLGEHNEHVLVNLLGIESSEVAKLRERGVV